ncbi:hypothetical protein DFH27DRAFT_84927 [Peziza echinospora]|nr:hypothetical protein DFH27DRAFT_84927 [Peziza echinospora]
MVSLPLAAILVLAWSLYTVASLFVALRLWVRIKRNNQRLNISDGFMSICWLANAVACVAITYWALIHLKHGKYELIGVEFVRKAVVADQEAALKASVVAAFAYYFCLWSLKLSMLCQYFSLFEHLKKTLKWVLSGSTALTAALFVVVIILNMTRCLPMKNNWTIMPIEDFCVSFMQKDVFLFSTVANVVTDLIVMILPFFVLHALPRPIKKRSERVAIVVIVILGLLSILFSIVRYVRVAHTSRWVPEKFSMTEVAIWTIFQLQIAMVAGCLPSLRVLLSDKRQTKIASQYHEKLDSLGDQESILHGTVKSNFTYIPSEKFGTWTLPRTSLEFPAPPVLSVTAPPRSPMSHSYDHPDQRASSQYSTSSWNSSFVEQTATVVQIPSAYTPGVRRFDHNRNFSADSNFSTMTSEEVYITMELTPRPGQNLEKSRGL